MHINLMTVGFSGVGDRPMDASIVNVHSLHTQRGQRIVLSMLVADFQIIFDRDPAARNWLEVLLCYPGLQAIMLHRLAHKLHTLNLPIIPRLVSQLSRLLTGIEIHPGAVIGKGLCIDHGMGVVIGETAILGDYCLIYQGVTLGGTGKETGKRHPTLGDNVVVGAGAKVLGNLQIGSNVRVGAGSVVLRDVPSDCTVVGVPGRIVYRAGEKAGPLEHGRLPDSEAQVIRLLLDRIELLEQQVQTLTHQASVLQATHAQSADSAVTHGPSSHPPGKDGHHDNEPASINTPQTVNLKPSKTVVAAAPMPTSIPKVTQSCQLKDKVIEQFLDSSGL